MRRDRIGVQLYTLRDHTATDMEGTLRQVAGMGYPAVEFAGYGDSTPSRIRALLEELGMVAIAAHVQFDEWRDRPDDVLDELEALGAAYGVVPSVPSETRVDAAAVADLGRLLDRWGERCRERGVGFAYHNHDPEFATVDGTTVWEALVSATDPELVGFELDLYWAAYGGADPVDLLRRHADRVHLLHAKDMADMADMAAGAQRRDAPVGDGILPWDDLVDHGRPGEADRWYIVEQDTPDDPLADVRRSLRFLEDRTEGAGA